MKECNIATISLLDQDMRPFDLNMNFFCYRLQSFIALHKSYFGILIN